MNAPFPYFGGKAKVAADVWAALGECKHYIEPFFGSGAVLLARPAVSPSLMETVCDADGHIANVWRALRAAPDEVAKWCDWPVNHLDLIARKKPLVAEAENLAAKLAEDADYYNAKLAGYWIWAASCWIGSGLTRPTQIPHVSDAGKGVHALKYTEKRPHVGDAGMGVDVFQPAIYEAFRALSDRLRRVRVVCGDWTRVCGGNWQSKQGVCGMFFDPPYGHEAGRCKDIYDKDCLSVAGAVREWCLERGVSEDYRIVLAGYYEEHESLLSAGWAVKRWSANGGYGNVQRIDGSKANGKENRHKEALFFSPHCLGQSSQRDDWLLG